MTAYLWPVKPRDTNPAIPKDKVIDEYGTDGCPLRCVRPVRQPDHGDEDDEADRQRRARVH